MKQIKEKFNFKKNAFTIIELTISVAVMWILMMATIVYLTWSDEKRKIIEAQWCSSTLWWEINNFVFYALTSKNLRLSTNNIVSPNYYIVQLTWWTSGCNSVSDRCNEIIFSYQNSSWAVLDNQIQQYDSISVSRNCRWSQPNLIFFWSWWNNIKYTVMNKWFLPISVTNRKVFYVQEEWNSDSNKLLIWDIIIALCMTDDCPSPKEISKFAIDARSQTISLKNCKFYENNLLSCKERES